MKNNKLIFNLILFITVFCFPAIFYAQNNKYDCFYLSENLDNEKLFQNIPLIYYFGDNTANYRKDVLNNNEKTLKKIISVMDKIYETNKKKYNYINKLEYLCFRNALTLRYSIEESIVSLKSYLYLSYKIVKESEKNSKIRLTDSYDMRHRVVMALDQYFKVKEKVTLEEGLKYWEPIILNDPELVKNPDLNNLF